MRGVQTYIKDSIVQDMIFETYGVRVEQFCAYLQKYVWTFLGQGSMMGLPWSRARGWPQLRLTSPNYPDLTTAKNMWYEGFDLYEVLQRLGPSPTARFNSVNWDQEENGNSLS